jgi:hypothetical protein
MLAEQVRGLKPSQADQPIHTAASSQGKILARIDLSLSLNASGQDYSLTHSL